MSGEHVDVVRELLEKQPSSVDDVLITGVGDNKSDLVKIALAKGGLSKETLTTALYIAGRDKNSAETADLLKKAGAVPPPDVDAATLQSYVRQVQGRQTLKQR